MMRASVSMRCGYRRDIPEKFRICRFVRFGDRAGLLQSDRQKLLLAIQRRCYSMACAVGAVARKPAAPAAMLELGEQAWDVDQGFVVGSLRIDAPDELGDMFVAVSGQKRLSEGCPAKRTMHANGRRRGRVGLRSIQIDMLYLLAVDGRDDDGLVRLPGKIIGLYQKLALAHERGIHPIAE